MSVRLNIWIAFGSWFEQIINRNENRQLGESEHHLMLYRENVHFLIWSLYLLWFTEAVAVCPYLFKTHTKIFMEEMKECLGLLKKKIKGAGDRDKNKAGQSRSAESGWQVRGGSYWPAYLCICVKVTNPKPKTETCPKSKAIWRTELLRKKETTNAICTCIEGGI